MLLSPRHDDYTLADARRYAITTPVRHADVIAAYATRYAIFTWRR